MASFSVLVILESLAYVSSLRKFRRKKCKGLMSSESGTPSAALFQPIRAVMETSLQLSQVDFGHNISD